MPNRSSRRQPLLRVLISAAVCIGTFCLCLSPLGAQSQSDSQAGPETIQHLDAVVVSSTDGRPVPRVLVTSPDRRMAAMTDSQGRFSFDLRRAGSAVATHIFSSWPPDPTPAASTVPVRLLVRKPGYVAATLIRWLGDRMEAARGTCTLPSQGHDGADPG